MPQELILPISDARLNASYKSVKYRKYWGFEHYGTDLGSASKNRIIKGMGNGKVIAAGLDGRTEAERLGRCLVIVYKNILLRDGTVTDAACRMFHMESISVSPGDWVDKDTILGIYGSTGAIGTGPHLHIEFDSDIKYPRYAVGIKGSGNVIKKGSVDSTINPAEILHLGKNQTISTEESWIKMEWVRRSDLDLKESREYKTKDENDELEAELLKYKEENERLRNLFKSIKDMVAEV